MIRPQKGDIIRFPRTGYSHFGIYIGDGLVIHRPGEPKRGDGHIRKDTLEYVTGETKTAYIANYLDNDKSRGFFVNTVRWITGRWRPLLEPYSPEEIVERARSQLGQEGYDVVFKNCEHFVTWCRYGEASSDQIDRFAMMALHPFSFYFYCAEVAIDCFAITRNMTR